MANPPLEAVLDGMILDALAEDLDLVLSYAISSREAAIRGDAKLIGVHVAQLRLCVIEVISKCKELASGATAPP
jgi:hypothetical protein